MEESEDEEEDFPDSTAFRISSRISSRITAQPIRNIPTEDTPGMSASGILMDLITVANDLITQTTIQDMHPKEEVGVEEDPKIIIMEDKKIRISTKIQL